MSDIMISVAMTSYNHEKYLRDAIEGVLNQETNYSYEIFIHDDASTDKSQEIIKEYADQYPDIINTILQEENQCSKGLSFNLWDFVFSKVNGKYIAICECDDCWTDNRKLQKQISFMEEHPECSMTLHNAWVLDSRNGRKTILNPFQKEGYIDNEEQIKVGLGSKFPATASYVFRRELLKEIPDFVLSHCVKDYPLRQYMATKGKVYYFDQIMSVYRYMTSGSSMDTIAKKAEGYLFYILDIREFYEKFDEYTQFKYHDIFKRKIFSDYLGLYIAIKDSKLFEKIESDRDKELLKSCSSFFKIKSDTELNDFINNNDSIWIYGASNLALFYTEKLEENGYMISGYAVTDGYSKEDTKNGLPVKYISEINNEKEGFLIVAQPINSMDMENELIRRGISNYYIPFKVNH